MIEVTYTLYRCGHEDCSNYGLEREIEEQIADGEVQAIPAGDIRRRCEGNVTLEVKAKRELTHVHRQCFRPLDRITEQGIEHVDAELQEPDETLSEPVVQNEE